MKLFVSLVLLILFVSCGKYEKPFITFKSPEKRLTGVTWECVKAVDVDGNELDVMHGFPKLLKSKSIKSIMIEIDPHDNESKNKIFSHMLENFFFIDAKISTKSNYFFKKKLI